MKLYLYRWVPEAARRPHFHFRIFCRYSTRHTLYAVAGFHWILQLAVWLQHRWAVAANSRSILEYWLGRELDPCRRGHRFTERIPGKDGNTVTIVTFHHCLRCGAPNSVACLSRHHQERPGDLSIKRTE